jgi:hypothetical protein
VFDKSHTRVDWYACDDHHMHDDHKQNFIDGAGALLPSASVTEQHWSSLRLVQLCLGLQLQPMYLYCPEGPRTQRLAACQCHGQY